MTQNDLNKFVTDKQKTKTLDAKSLVQIIHQHEIRGVAMKYRGGIVEPTGPGPMTFREFKEAQKKLKVSNNLKGLVNEFDLKGIGFYAIDYSEEWMNDRYRLVSIVVFVIGIC